MIHIALLARGAQKTEREQQAQSKLADGDAERKRWFSEQRGGA